MSIITNKQIYDPSQGDPLKPLKDTLDVLDKQLQDIAKRINQFTTELRQVEKTGSGAELKQLTEGMTKLNSETQKYNKVNDSRTKIANEIAKAEKKLADLQTEESKQLAGLRLEIQELNAERKKEAKQSKVSETSIVGLNIQLSKLRKEYDLLSKEQRENDKVGGELLRQIQKLDAETKQLTASTGRFQKNVGNYPGLFGNTTVSLKGLGSELLAAGGVVGGVQLLVDGFKALTDQVGKNIEVTKQLNASFNLGSREARLYAADILAIADTFDQDYNEVTQAAISVSKQLGISLEEATAKIEEGFLKGSNNSGEFLDILKEYPAQFAAAGIGADQAFAIINQQVTEGIYSDKGVDAIKEAGLRLRENTKAVQDALAPLDASIRKQIEQEVAAGRSFEAIKLVSEALNDTSLTAEETQAIVADVFGGPGEDAGLRYLQTLKDIDTNLENVSISATESEQANLNLSKSWNNFVAGVSDSGGFIQKTFNFLKDALAGAVNSLAFLIDKVNEFTSKSSGPGGPIQLQKDLGEVTKKTNQEIKKSEQELEAERKANEEKQKIRYQAYLARQKQIERENAKRLAESQKRIEQTAIEAEIEDENLQLEFEREEALTNKKIEELDKFVEASKVANENVVNDQLLSAEAQKQILQETYEFAGETLGNLLADGKLTVENFGKVLNASILNILEKQLVAAIAQITFTQAAKGIGGLVLIPLLTGLVKGAFTVAKSKLLQFAEGTEYVHGPGTETSDSIPAMLSKGERVLTASQNKQINGISNDNLVELAQIGKFVTENNDSKIIEKLDRLGLAYKKSGYWYIERGNGKVEKFKE